MQNYKIANKKGIINLFIFSSDIDRIIQETPLIEEIGYAGFKEKNELRESLNSLGIDGRNGKILEDNQETIRKLVESVIKKCEYFLDGSRYIFIFPTYDEFVAEKMKGVNGFTSHEKTILIFIHPIKNWEEGLKNIIIHEIAHTISGYYGDNNYTLGESLIHEGLAENFRESLMGGREPWTEAISEERSKEIFKEIKNLLDIPQENLHEELFFGTGKYPNWAGYTIGYYLVKDYLNKKFQNQKVDWNKLLRENPKKILSYF